MTRKKDAPQEPVGKTFVFTLKEVGSGQHNWVGSFVKDGKVRIEITEPNSYQYCAAVLGSHLHLAIYE